MSRIKAMIERNHLEPGNMPHIKQPWIETPLVESTVLSKIAGWYSATPFHPLE